MARAVVSGTPAAARLVRHECPQVAEDDAAGLPPATMPAASRRRAAPRPLGGCSGTWARRGRNLLASYNCHRAVAICPKKAPTVPPMAKTRWKFTTASATLSTSELLYRHAFSPARGRATKGQLFPPRFVPTLCWVQSPLEDCQLLLSSDSLSGASDIREQSRRIVRLVG